MKVEPDEATQTTQEAYVFGYPLVLMDVTRQLLTAVPHPEGAHAPVNQFAHLRAFPDPTFTDVVAPNADTLYSVAWLDLSEEPIVLSVPDVGDRYYMMPMLDGWTNVFAAPGTRTTGNGEGDFAVVGPGWSGELPEGITEIRSPTDMVWIIGRTKTNGKADYTAVNAIQDQYRLTPLSARGTDYSPPDDVPVDPDVDTATAPVDQVAQMDAPTFFGRLCALMENNPPAAADAAAMKRFATIGIVPGKAFAMEDLDPETAEAFASSVPAGQARIAEEAERAMQSDPSGGWSLPMGLGNYGTDYPKRAAIALVGLGANLSEDAIYATTTLDSEGQPFTGSHRYTMHFPAGQLPPVNGFWSLTMYNSRMFFVENPLGRYAIGDRDALHYNEDDSLDIYIQHESPGQDKESNWLPAPPDSFNVMMRMYWPKQEVLDATWTPQAVKRLQ